jgi:hypothetical protein
MRGWAVLLCVAVLGCEEPEPVPPEERNLVEPHDWLQVDESVDVFAHLRPPEVECFAVDGFAPSWLGSEPSFEINTGRCNYLTIGQPTIVDIRAGDPMKLRLWHFELTSMDVDAHAYAAVAIDGELAWEATIPIPSASGLEVAEWEALADAAAGAEMQFHLHNHGLNSWDLLSVTVTN